MEQDEGQVSYAEIQGVLSEYLSFWDLFSILTN